MAASMPVAAPGYGRIRPNGLDGRALPGCSPDLTGSLGTQNAQIRTALILTGIKLTSAQIGG
jgi:hypothetical protein